MCDIGANRHHRVAVLLLLGALAAASLWRLRIGAPDPHAGCDHPVGSVIQGRLLVLCWGQPVADADAVLGRLGAPAWAVGLAKGVRISGEEVIRVGADGELRRDVLPARERLVLGLPISLNRASAVDLQRLPGVGSVLAGRIVAYRDRHGPFRSVEGLQRVKGVGPVLLERLRALLRVDTHAGPPAGQTILR